MPVLALQPAKENYRHCFRFWSRAEIRLPWKGMKAWQAAPMEVFIGQARLLFEKNKLRVQALFTSPAQLPEELFVRLELCIRTAAKTNILLLGPFKTREMIGGVELDRFIDIKRVRLNPLGQSYRLSSLNEIRLQLGTMGQIDHPDLFGPLAEAAFSKKRNSWA